VAKAANPLPERGLSGIVEELFRIYSGNFFQLLGLVAIPSVPLLFLSVTLNWYVSVSPLEQAGEILFAFLLTISVVVVSILVSILMPALVAYGVAQQYLGKIINIGSAFRFVFHRLGSLVGAAFLVGLAVLAMAITIIGIPAAIYFGLTWSFVLQVVVLEGSGARKSLSRSSFLVKNNWWRVLGILLILVLIGSVLSAAAEGLVGFTAGWVGEAAGASGVLKEQVVGFAGGLARIIFTPVTLIGATLLYFDLRVRKEGYTVGLMAQELSSD
jgi:hypothetical protein